MLIDDVAPGRILVLDTLIASIVDVQHPSDAERKKLPRSRSCILDVNRLARIEAEALDQR